MMGVFLITNSHVAMTCAKEWDASSYSKLDITKL